MSHIMKSPPSFVLISSSVQGTLLRPLHLAGSAGPCGLLKWDSAHPGESAASGVICAGGQRAFSIWETYYECLTFEANVQMSPFWKLVAYNY